jgi:hypothetical protein
MPIIKLDDHCRKCNKLIGVNWAKSKCPLCGVPSPVEPVGFIQEMINTIYVLGVSLGFLFLFGLVILIGIIFIFFMKNI